MLVIMTENTTHEGSVQNVHEELRAKIRWVSYAEIYGFASRVFYADEVCDEKDGCGI